MSIDMDTFTSSDLSTLINTDSQFVASLYMPTEQSGREVRQNAIRFKNLMQQLQDQLEKIAEPDLQAAQQQAWKKYVENEDWWQHQSKGLGLLSPRWV